METNNLAEIKKFILERESVLKPLFRNTNLAYFNAAVTGKKEFYKEYERLQIETEKTLNNKNDFLQIKKFLYGNFSLSKSHESYSDLEIKKFLELEISDPFVKRQLKILYNIYLGSQGDIKLIEEIVKKSTAVENKFNLFRAKIKEKELSDNEIKKILENEKDSLRLKEAWEASKKQGESVAKELLELINLRNNLAKSLGFRDYYSMSMEIGEQEEVEIEKIFDELLYLTNTPFQELKKEMDEYLSNYYRFPVEELKPWHYQDLFFQEGPEIHEVNLDEYFEGNVIKTASDFYLGIGLDVKDILGKSDLYEKKGKYQHACCMDIDREGDIRIIENVKNNEKWMDTTLHELGHAVYDKYIDKEVPYFLRHAAHIFTTEAIAMLFGRNSRNISFIKRYSMKKMPDGVTNEIHNMLRLRQLVFSQWSQVMFRFERELYKNPNQDLNKLWYSMVKKYQLLDFYRDKPDWASKIHFVSSPVYYHNYLLGELLASQIHNCIVKNILKEKSLKNVNYSGKKEIGDYLKKNIFSVGKKYKWDEMIKRATGENLTSKYFVEQFC